MRPLKLFGLAAAIALAAATNILAQGSSFTQIDFPAATATQTWGISPRGVIVGFYTSAAGGSHGFSLSGGQYTAIDFPGSALTLVNGIGSQGNIVGEYALTSTAAHRGFLLSSGSFISIDYPGATTTAAIGTNAAGDIVGIYSQADDSSHGFLLRDGKYTSIDYPNATTSLVNGMNDLGDVVGGYSIAGVTHGFLLRNSHFTSIDYAAAVYTTVTGINPKGDLVGRYRDVSAVNHGFLLSQGQYTSIDYPSATFTGATAINPAGDILGRCIVAGVTHGYLLKSKEGRYTITDLGPVGPTGQPFSVTNSDLVGGVAVVADGAEHAVLWRKGQTTDIGTLGIGISNSVIFSVNDGGQATGQAEAWGTDPNHEDFCGFKALGLPTWNQKCLPFLYQNGSKTALPTLGGFNGVGSGINATGDVAGWAENTTADPTCPSPQRYQFRPVIWQKGKIQELPTVQTDPEGVAIQINDAGMAVGASGSCSTYSPNTLTPLQPLHAILWHNGKATDLGNLGGTGHGAGNLALGINQKGQVVGISDIAGDTTGHAFLWNKDSGMQDLGTLPGDMLSSGVAINDSGEVVGVSLDEDFNLHAFHWQNGDMQQLNDLVVGDSPLVLLLACSINSHGEIIGLALDTETGDLHGYLATPSNGGSVAHSISQPLSENAKQLVQKRLGKRPIR